MHPKIKERLVKTYVDTYLKDRAAAAVFISRRLTNVKFRERKEINDAVRGEFRRRGFKVLQ